MAVPTKTPMLVDAEPETQAVALAPAGDQVALMFERLARDPAVDVEKLEKLIGMQERILAHSARAAFESAFAEMQGELPAIDERGRILVGETVRSRYARYEDIQQAIRPVLKKFGFALRHREEDLPDGKLRIVGVLSHRDGHREEDKFDCPPDASGGKSNIQAIGSTRSYGMRYTTISLLNIETRGMDTDGAPPQAAKEPAAAPAGFDDWLANLTAVSDEGLPRLESTWKDSRIDYRNHLTRIDRGAYGRLKDRASKVRPGA